METKELSANGLKEDQKAVLLPVIVVISIMVILFLLVLTIGGTIFYKLSLSRSSTSYANSSYSNESISSAISQNRVALSDLGLDLNKKYLRVDVPTVDEQNYTVYREDLELSSKDKVTQVDVNAYGGVQQIDENTYGLVEKSYGTSSTTITLRSFSFGSKTPLFTYEINSSYYADVRNIIWLSPTKVVYTYSWQDIQPEISQTSGMDVYFVDGKTKKKLNSKSFAIGYARGAG